MYLSYKYPLYPTKVQEAVLIQWEGACRWLYNKALAANTKRYNKSKKFIFYNEMVGKLKDLKAKNPWLKEVYSQCLQQTLKTLEKAIKAVYQSDFGFPKFRCHGQSYSITVPQHWTCDRGFIYLPKFKEGIRFHKYRPFVGKPKELKIVKEGQQWFCVIVCQQKDKPQLKVKPSDVIGLDVGSVRLATTSDNRFKRTQDLTKQERRKRRLQRELDRRSRKTKKGNLKREQSQRRSKTLKKLRSISRHISCKRKDYLHKYTSCLVDRATVVVVEDLNIKGMTSHGGAYKKGLNRSILQQGWYNLFTMLDYKLRAKGGFLIKVNPAYTSQTCSACGCVSKKNRRSQSLFVCKDCGFTLNADQNAAQNIRNLGLAKLAIAA